MFPLRSLPVHVASAGGGEVLFNRFFFFFLLTVCRTGQARLSSCLVGVCLARLRRATADRPKQTGGPNYCNPARGASCGWMMTMFRSAGRGRGGSGARMRVFWQGQGLGKQEKRKQGGK